MSLKTIERVKPVQNPPARLPEPLHINYLFDPLCGWCYGASPVLEQLVGLPGLTVEFCPTGLFADRQSREMNAGFADYAWSNDQRIARLTGQRFTEAYRSQVLADHATRFDSGPATRALTAVAVTAPAFEYAALNAIQQARYVDGLDITQEKVLVQVLNELGLMQAADLLCTQADTLLTLNAARLAKGRSIMTTLGINGVPALVVGQGENLRAVDTSGLFTRLEAVLETLAVSSGAAGSALIRHTV